MTETQLNGKESGHLAERIDAHVNNTELEVINKQGVIMDKIPYSFSVIKSIQGQVTPHRPLLCLFDSGSTLTWIRRGALPSKVEPAMSKQPVVGSTMAGKFTSFKEVKLQGITVPEFSPTRALDSLRAQVMEADCRYDIIFGRDFCTMYGIVLDFEEQEMHSLSTVVPMREMGKAQPGEISISEMLERDCEDAMLMDDMVDMLTAVSSDDKPLEEGYKSKTFKSTLSKERDIASIIEGQEHLSASQREELRKTLEGFKSLFDGKLGEFKKYEVELEVKEGAIPKQSRPYPVPRVHLKAYEARLNELVELGVLERAPRSEWISPSFIVPKKDASARFVTDLRAFNASLKRKVYPIPIIQDLLRKRTSYKYVTILDLSDQYYTFVIKEGSRHYLTTATPFGLFRYKRLPQGINIGPDVAQEAMENLFRHLYRDVSCYIDDISIFSDSWEEHLERIREVCQILEEAGFKVNPNKCDWAKQEVKFLGHVLTPDGVKPQVRKVQGIISMRQPENLKQLRSFLGMVTYYRDMWPRRAHILAPLTDLLGTTRFVWDKQHHDAFQRMKALIVKDTMLMYPNPNKPYIIETDASNYQLGGVLKQFNEKFNKYLPVAFFSRKLSEAQKKYTTIEQELLSIVETLKEFRSLLLGSRILIRTDHKNLTHEMTQFTTQRVLRWRLILEEYGPTFVHVPGKDNLIADALSRVPMDATPLSEEGSAALFFAFLSDDICQCLQEGQVEDLLAMPMHDVYTAESCTVDNRMTTQTNDSLLYYPVFDNRLGYCDFPTIERYQNEDQQLQQSITTNPNLFRQQFGTSTLVCSRTADNDWKIVLTNAILPRIIRWYHEFLLHSEGADRLYRTIARHFEHPNLKKVVHEYVSNCDTCKRMKTGHRQQGQLAPRLANAAPWEEVHIDCIGNWHFKISKTVSINLRALTMIDPVTNLLEVVRLDDVPTASSVMRAFENTWLSRYPKPERVVCDRGPEFIGHEFPQKLLEAGIKHRPVTAMNPQSNGIIERVHQTMALILRVMIDQRKPKSQEECDRICEDGIATIMHATRAAAHSQLDYCTPGSIAFGRDMVFNIPVLVDLVALRDNRQEKIDQRLLRANLKRSRVDFQPGMQVYTSANKKTKLEPPFDGPYTIERTHTNGTVTVRLSPHVTDRINIRRCKPA